MGQIVARYVISLEGSPRRKAFFSQPSAQGFKVWNAVDGRTGGGRDRFNVAGFQSRYGREPLGGEIGCALSHVDLLAHFAASPGGPNDLMIVAEDDAVLSPAFEAVVQRIARRPNFGWANLAQPTEDFRHEPFWAWNRGVLHVSALARPVGGWPFPWRFRLGASEGPIGGAGLYMVTREASSALVAHSEAEGVSWVADGFTDWHEPAGVRFHVLVPNLAGWSGGSEISSDRFHLKETAIPRHSSRLSAWKLRAYRARRSIGVARRSSIRQAKAEDWIRRPSGDTGQ